MPQYLLQSIDGRLTASLSLMGGMLTQLNYHPTTSLSIPVLYQAPWLKQTFPEEAFPPLLHHLAGEWVGVPFGGVTHDDSLFFANAPHGLPANQQWQLEQINSKSIRLRFDYPQDYPLRRLVRTITLTDNGDVEFSLSIEVHYNCTIPVGLHPIFPVGGAVGKLQVQINGDYQGITYPKPVEPRISQLAIGQIFTDLSQVPTIDHQTINLSRLPLAIATEEIVQILSLQQGITLFYPQSKLKVTLTWDTQALPSCLLWISNGGRYDAPWNGDNYCLGVEPVASAWDLGPSSLTDNPISQQRIPSALTLQADQIRTIHYRLNCTLAES